LEKTQKTHMDEKKKDRVNQIIFTVLFVVGELVVAVFVLYWVARIAIYAWAYLAYLWHTLPH
jgi:hypothetical protein